MKVGQAIARSGVMARVAAKADDLITVSFAGHAWTAAIIGADA